MPNQVSLKYQKPETLAYSCPIKQFPFLERRVSLQVSWSIRKEEEGLSLRSRLCNPFNLLGTPPCRAGLPQGPADAGGLHGGADQDPAAGHGVRHAGRNSAGRPLRAARPAGHHDRRQGRAAHRHGPCQRCRLPADGASMLNDHFLLPAPKRRLPRGSKPPKNS